MAIEFARYNVQVNCVSPGPIYGDLLNKWPESKRLIAEWEQATVCDRLCVDRDVSHFIAYLLERRGQAVHRQRAGHGRRHLGSLGRRQRRTPGDRTTLTATARRQLPREARNLKGVCRQC